MPKTIEAPAWLEDEDAFSVPFLLPPEHAEVVAQPNRAAAAAAELEPCGGTFEAVLGVRYDRVSDAGLLNLLHASERHLAAMQARQVELLAEVARRDPDGERFLRDEAALALKAAPVTTNLRIKAAQQLTSRLWATHERCRDGNLSGFHARILADAVADLTDEVTAKVQRLVLKRA
jgi:hypothetical protein